MVVAGCRCCDVVAVVEVVAVVAFTTIIHCSSVATVVINFV